MTTYSNPDYDPGFLNSPGKGQGPTNPLAPLFIESLGVVSDLSVYRDIFTGSTVNAASGYTLGLGNFFSNDSFQVTPPGTFKDDITLEKDLTVMNNATVEKKLTVKESIVMEEKEFKPMVIQTISGPHLVLAAY